MQPRLGAAEGGLWMGTARGPSAGLVQVQHPQMDRQETLQVRTKGTLADACAGRKL